MLNSLSKRIQYYQDPLEPTNEPYALAKIAGIKLCENYYKQYSDNFISVMPNNLYGLNDNFHPDTSHVIPALIQKFHNAKFNSINMLKFGGLVILSVNFYMLMTLLKQFYL